MAYEDPGKEAEHRTSTLVHAVNAALKLHYKNTKNTDVANQISIAIDHGKGGQARTSEEQAEVLLKGTSWTANGSHMAAAAKHVLVRRGGKVTWDLKALDKNQTAAFNVMVEAWNKAMNAHDLRDYAGKKGFHWKSSDPLHMELPDSRLDDNDPRVIKTLEIYAKATRLEGKAKNLVYENEKGSDFQKKWLHQYDQKLAGQPNVQKVAAQPLKAANAPGKTWK